MRILADLAKVILIVAAIAAAYAFGGWIATVTAQPLDWPAPTKPLGSEPGLCLKWMPR